MHARVRGEVEPRGCGESAGLTGRCDGASTDFIYPRMCITNLKKHMVTTADEAQVCEIYMPMNS